MTTAVPAQNSRSPSRATWRVAFAWIAVVLTPAALVIGFVMGYVIGLDPSIADPVTGWDAAWRVVILWLIVVAFSVAGVVLAWSARRNGEPSALAALVVNALVFTALTVITLVAGMVDAFG